MRLLTKSLMLDCFLLIVFFEEFEASLVVSFWDDWDDGGSTFSLVKSSSFPAFIANSLSCSVSFDLLALDFESLLLQPGD